MAKYSYHVGGMTCAHCVSAVTREVQAVAGVTHVEVTLDGGQLAVEGDDVNPDAVGAAVAEAGYTLV